MRIQKKAAPKSRPKGGNERSQSTKEWYHGLVTVVKLIEPHVVNHAALSSEMIISECQRTNNIIMRRFHC